MPLKCYKRLKSNSCVFTWIFQWYACLWDEWHMFTCHFIMIILKHHMTLALHDFISLHSFAFVSERGAKGHRGRTWGRGRSRRCECVDRPIGAARQEPTWFLPYFLYISTQYESLCAYGCICALWAITGRTYHLHEIPMLNWIILKT